MFTLFTNLLKKVVLFYYQGYGDGFDDVIIQGDVDELKFVAFYTRYVSNHNCGYLLRCIQPLAHVVL